MKRFIFATLLIIIASTSAFAQTQAPAAPQFYRVQVINMNPGMADEWRKFYQTEIMPAIKKGGTKQSIVLNVTQGDVREYMIISPLESLAQLDELTSLAKALGQEAAHALNLKQGRFFAEWHSYITQARPDLSIAPASNEPTKFAVVAENWIAPGRTAEYEAFIKEKLTPLVKKTNAKGVLVQKNLLGGDPNFYAAFVLFDSYDEMGKFQLAKAAAELKLSPVAPAGVIAKTEWRVVRYVPELSLRPEPQKEVK